MQAIEVTDTATGVRVMHRALPALLQAVFFSGALAFHLRARERHLSNASWPSPFERLPGPPKQAPLYPIIGTGLAIMA
jgi:hypothetical protein